MKQTIELIKCDICGSEKECTNVNYPVWFICNQTDGYPCDPYISQQTIDLCKVCLSKHINIEGYGAMGHNTYTTKK